MCSDKKCQEKSVMWPVKPKKDMQLKKPAAKDKNCQVTMHDKEQVLYLRTITVNLPGFIGNQCVLTRTVKKRKTMLCSQ